MSENEITDGIPQLVTRESQEFPKEIYLSKISFIQKFFRNKKYNQICKTIFHIYKKYYPKLFKEPTGNRLTKWEKAGGYTERSRIGAKCFQNMLGYFFEEVWGTSNDYNKLEVDGDKGGNDGESMICLYEAKSRFNTMKGSQAYNEIKKKLEYAIQVKKDFKLLVLVDKDKPRIIPLHKGQALSQIKKIEGYDESRHLWVSSSEIFKHLFHSNSNIIENYIEDLLRYTNAN